MKPRVEWVRRPVAAHHPAAGWELVVDGIFVGHVWLDGSFTDAKTCWEVPCGSQPLAAQALLRAAGVEP